MQCKSCGQDNPPGARFCANCGATLETAVQPVTNIGVGSAYGNGWRQLWKYFLWLLLIGIIAFIIGIFGSIGQWVPHLASQLAPGELAAIISGIVVSILFGLAYGFLVNGPVNYGMQYAYLKAARNDKLEIKDMFAAFKNYWNVVLASLLTYFIVSIGFVLLIVPGIIFACKLAFTPYLVVDRKNGGN